MFRRQAISVAASGVPAAKPNLKASDGTPSSMKLYWSERMKELRGECRIGSGAGRGTRVVLGLPLPTERSALAPSPE